MSRFAVGTSGPELHFDDHPARADADAPCVTLIHGGLVDSRSWGVVPDLLAETMRVVTYDGRGFGRSDKPPTGYSLAESVADLRALWDHLGITRSHLLGFSQGGVIALATALTHPERVASLLLLGTFATRSEAERVGARARAEAALAGGIATQVEVHLERVFAPSFREARPDIVEHYLEPFADNDPVAFAATMRFMAEVDLVSDLGSIAAPTTVMVGSLDRAVGVEPSRVIHEAMPGSRFVVVEGAGHTVHVERPEQFAASVVEHVAWAEGRPWEGSRS